MVSILLDLFKPAGCFLRPIFAFFFFFFLPFLVFTALPPSKESFLAASTYPLNSSES